MKDQTIAFRNIMLPVLADGAGLFSWDMVANKLHGDAEMARLFGVDPGDLAAGVTVESIIGRMHVGDRERVAKALHTAILEGKLYRETYRVLQSNGDYFYVLCIARCFGYEGGLPTSCAGFVCEMESLEGAPKLRASSEDNVVHFRKRR